MTDLAAVPDSMFLMGKNNIGCPGCGNLYGKILLSLNGISFKGNAFEIINRFYFSLGLGFFPVNQVTG
jgi:hypothetical protein